MAQPPQAIKYKAIARDNHGHLLINQWVDVNIAILQGSENGITVFSEEHRIRTTNFGVMELEIGRGNIISGSMEAIDWGADDYYIRIEMDPQGHGHCTIVGTAQLLSVPYAFYAGSAGNNDDADADPQNELITDAVLNGTFLEITEGGMLTLVDLSGLLEGVQDADPDPTNELQDIYLSGTELSITGGSSVDLSMLPDNVEDADADPENEIQDLQLAGNILTITRNGTPSQIDLSVYFDNTDDQTLSITDHELSIEGGNTVTLPDLVEDADADPGNELQDLELAGDELTLSQDATPVDLSRYLDNTDDQNLSINDHELSIEGGNTITLPDAVDDADADPENELQDISLSGTSLSISGGSSVDLSILQDGYEPDTDDQILTISGHELSISEGNTITLPDEVNDADADPENELQELEIIDHELAISGKNKVVLPDNVNDADNNPNNELQFLSIRNDTIFLSEGGFVKLPSNSSITGQYYYADKDGDGFGYAFTAVYVPNGVNEPTNYISNNSDCDDNNADVNPLAPEINNDGIDNDCDGVIDKILGDPNADYDDDGFSINEGDCNDNNSDIFPEAIDTPGDGIDQNCDGLDIFNLIDVDGNVYDVTKIGDQIWMAENLRALHYADGSPLVKIEDDNSWYSMNLSDNAYCWYKNDSVTYAEKYGALYNFAAAVGGIYNYSWGTEKIQGVCPTGWHLPTLEEWTVLINYVEPLSTDHGWARYYLRSTEDWSTPGTDAYGFNAYPSQLRFSYTDNPDNPIVFNDIGIERGAYNNIILDETAAFWIDDHFSFFRGISDSYASVLILNMIQEIQSYDMPILFGCSVRCIKDLDDVDFDHDGFSTIEGDCNDNDPSINPRATEICDDGIDQDCDRFIDEDCTP
jgi:uncharacterized protein (TIGR02145 family)